MEQEETTIRVGILPEFIFEIYAVDTSASNHSDGARIVVEVVLRGQIFVKPDNWQRKNHQTGYPENVDQNFLRENPTVVIFLSDEKNKEVVSKAVAAAREEAILGSCPQVEKKGDSWQSMEDLVKEIADLVTPYFTQLRASRFREEKPLVLNGPRDEPENVEVKDLTWSEECPFDFEPGMRVTIRARAYYNPWLSYDDDD